MGSSASISVAPARSCAYAVQRRVFEGGAFADRALVAEAGALSARDRALAMRLAYGSIQRKATLDHLIEALAERPVARLDPPILAALRLGLYELCFLHGAPDRAVVDDAVELAKGHARAGHGLVNAVLRRAARDGSSALLTGLSDDTPEQAALMHSHPEWVARMWFATLGPEHARALMAFDNEPSELALRANTLVTDAPSLLRAIGGAQALAVPARTDTPSSPARTVSSSTAVFAHLDPDLPEALVLDGPFDVRSSRLWEQGAFVAQSRAAMHVARALAPQPGERVLDVCAAPGGKTTHLAALMDGRGEVVALERDRARADQLARTVTRLRAGNVRIVIADGAVPSERAADFDRVLVDPPCSGLGTLQARADLRWRATPQSLAAAARQAREILGASAQRLRPGGLLVYSTCTISPAENEHVIADFLDSHADFSLDDLGADLPAHAHPARTGGVGASSSAEPAAEIASRCVLTLPHRDRTAGFFIARLRRG